MDKKATFTAVIHLEEDLYVAECPEVGTVSQGSTIEEAIENLKEATELYLEEFPIDAGPLTFLDELRTQTPPVHQPPQFPSHVNGLGRTGRHLNLTGPDPARPDQIPVFVNLQFAFRGDGSAVRQDDLRVGRLAVEVEDLAGADPCHHHVASRQSGMRLGHDRLNPAG